MGEIAPMPESIATAVPEFEPARERLVTLLRAWLAKDGNSVNRLSRISNVPRVSIDRVLAGSHAGMCDQFDRLGKAIGAC